MTAVSPPSIEERLQALAAVIHQASCASVLLKAPWDQLAQSPPDLLLDSQTLPTASGRLRPDPEPMSGMGLWDAVPEL